MGKEISEKELKAAEIPPYLRFDLVKLSYIASESDEGTINERFAYVMMILQPYKQALSGSKFKFLGRICNSCSKSDFKDSSMLLDHIDKLLQISARCRAYKFYIEHHINENTPTANVLATILQFDEIIRCSKIRVEFDFWYFTPTHLPIEAIGNWLNRTNAIGQDNERFLKLKICDDVPNLGEMFEYLKKVCRLILLHF